jgi:hypothetical protein
MVVKSLSLYLGTQCRYFLEFSGSDARKILTPGVGLVALLGFPLFALQILVVEEPVGILGLLAYR